MGLGPGDPGRAGRTSGSFDVSFGGRTTGGVGPRWRSRWEPLRALKFSGKDRSTGDRTTVETLRLSPPDKNVVSFVFESLHTCERAPVCRPVPDCSLSFRPHTSGRRSPKTSHVGGVPPPRPGFHGPSYTLPPTPDLPRRRPPRTDSRTKRWDQGGAPQSPVKVFESKTEGTEIMPPRL